MTLISYTETDISSPDFPGILPRDSGFMGPRPTPDQHPNLRLEETMTSVPSVKPGDTVFWHCDVVHSVEAEHTGTEDSAGPSNVESRLILIYTQLCTFLPCL